MKQLMNKEHFAILIYLFLLFLIDYSGIIDIYNQNIIRRLINMYRRTDPLNYKNKLNSFCKKYDKILDEKDIKILQSIRKDEGLDNLCSLTTTLDLE